MTDQQTGLAFTAVTVNIPLEMVPNLIISILLDFFSLTITGCDFQGWPSPLPPPPFLPPWALWCLIRGQGRPARHSAQTLAPFPQCTMHSSPLLWGLEEITQPGELWKALIYWAEVKNRGNKTFDSHSASLCGKTLKAPIAWKKREEKINKQKKKRKINIPVLTLVNYEENGNNPKDTTKLFRISPQR